MNRIVDPITHRTGQTALLGALPHVVVTVSQRAAARLASGHPWAYRSDIESVSAGERPPEARTPQPESALCEVRTARGRFVAHGFLNSRSVIAVRVFSRSAASTLDERLVAERTRAAVAARRPLLSGMDPATAACRLVFAEGDGLPGMVVDKFGPVLVFQSLALAAELCRDVVLQVLLEDRSLGIRQVIERNDAPVRELEGLPQRKGLWPPDGSPSTAATVEIREGDCHYLVDTLDGQKTGFYLDQRDNRLLVRSLAARLAGGSEPLVPANRRVDVLDCFSYTGGFAVAAGRGAGPLLGHLVCVDSSEPALALARRNLELNGGELALRSELVAANVFDYLRGLDAASGEARRMFDLIILDPPPFARERRMLAGAVRGYKEINLRAMKLLRPGGFLVTATCSHYVSRELLQEICRDAATDARRSLRIVTATGQPADHPVLLGHPEGDYLRCLVLQDVGG